MRIYIIPGMWCNDNYYVKVMSHHSYQVLNTPNGYKRKSDVSALVQRLLRAWPNATVYTRTRGYLRFRKVKFNGLFKKG